jgi:transaldolase/glucose-6-phosphate isomerase
MGNPPVEVQAFGQSIWIDNIRRKLLNDGTFQRLIDESGVVGVTSNPSIFQKAIGGSDDYDETIRQHITADVNTLYETLAVADIQQAADLFAPVYTRTAGRDGYVSLEVSPLLARDTEGTIAEAKRLFAAVGRPNVMIKIPATPEGIPAIEEVIAAGINVNVTLIFSVQNYLQVAEAYIRGLEQRMKAGQPVTGIASVASFFLSRIDTLIDQVLENNILAAQGRDLEQLAANTKLLGKAAIANAQIAYKRFMELFYGERFRALREAGASVQRPLWASTSTKNPAYPDTLYIDALIGRDTVNTVPPDTLVAFKDHGTVRESILDGIDGAEAVMDGLKQVGVEVEAVTKRLQDDGVDAFAQSFTSLMEQLESKRQHLAGSTVEEQQRLALGIYATGFQAALKSLETEFAVGRVWGKDGSLWRDHAPTITKIENRLGWLDVLNTIDLARLKDFQAGVKNQFSHVVLMGMGGSSLAPEVLSDTFGSADGFPKLLMLDSTHPGRVLDIERQIDLSTTLFISASKSGGTIETTAFTNYFWEKSGRNGAQFVAITDPGTTLADLARENKYRDVFENPADIGGRFSALSYFGMVPAALLGIDLDAFWGAAREMINACGSSVAAADHPGAVLGTLLGALALKGRDKLCIFASPSIASFGSWAEQLVAESTGKEGKGIVPVVGTSVGMPHDYASDRLFVYLKVEGDPGNAELDPQIRALREAGHPRLTLLLKDKYAIAGEFFRWEFATAIAGRMFAINPFDEPNVTESKQNTARLLEYYKAHGELPESTAAVSKGSVQLYAAGHSIDILHELVNQHGFDQDNLVQVVAAHLAASSAGDYYALLAYVNPTAAVEAKLETVRRRIRHVTKRAVTSGIGPRYLHSTGQLHKGGPPNGVFILLTANYAEDAEIPGMPFSFATLHAAQASGDYDSLDSHKLRAIRLHLGDDPVAGLDIVQQAIDVLEARRR